MSTRTGALTAAGLPDEIREILWSVVGEEPGLEVLSAAPESEGGFVAAAGDRVIKVHAAACDPGELGLRLAAVDELPEVFLPRLTVALRLGGRIVTVWPRREPVDPAAPDDVPWVAAAQLLARLHTVAVPAAPGPASAPFGRLPPHGFPASVGDALARLAATTDDTLSAAGVPTPCRSAVMEAARSLPGWALDRRSAVPPGRPISVVHGDFHLGQLVRAWPGGLTAAPNPQREGVWRLIDMDALGVGDPGWDLARPAMWSLAGVIAPDQWAGFLAAYVAAGGTAVQRDGPWPVLEPFARAAAVQAAASALARAGRTGLALEDEAEAFVAACQRIADLACGPGG